MNTYAWDITFNYGAAGGVVCADSFERAIRLLLENEELQEQMVSDIDLINSPRGDLAIDAEAETATMDLGGDRLSITKLRLAPDTVHLISKYGE